MRSYGQYCPVAKGAEVLGDRWTLLIVRELLFGPLRFGEIERGLPGISRSVLTERLRRLVQFGIVSKGQTGYALTPAGEELRAVVEAVGDWVGRWIIGDPTPAELDPELLVLWISRHVHRQALPERRVVVEFDFTDPGSRRLWLLLDRHDVSVCLEYPGLPVDLVVTAATRDLYRVYMGRLDFDVARSDGLVAFDGLPAYSRAFSSWMAWSHFAPAVRAGAAVQLTPAR